MPSTTFLVNATVVVNGVDFSDQCKTVGLTPGYDQLEKTAMGDTGHTYTAGLQTVTVAMDLFNSYGAGEVEATLFAVCGTSITIDISPSGSTESVTNPVYTIVGAFLPTFTPVNGSVGELSMVTATFTGGTWARDITP